MSAPSTSRIVIGGWGLITPLGQSAWETFRALLAGRTLTDRADRLPPDVEAVDMIRALGCVSVAQVGATDPAVELAERAGREALSHAGVPASDALILLGGSKGAAHAWYAAACRARGLNQPLLGQRWPFDAELSVALGPHAYVAHHLSRRLGAPALPPVVAACASSLTALHQARHLLLGHRPTCVPTPRHILLLTSEAALLPLFVHSYRRLGVLPPLRPDDYRARPLDRRRCGFLLAEVGAAVLLQALPPGQAPQPGQVELLDTAVASEAQDIVRPAQPMAALQRVAADLLRDRSIDLLHPHATGTESHDEVEMAVYGDCLSQAAPDVYADKGALGHTLGSAGLVSLVLACLCAQSGRRPPMPWLSEPIACSLPLHAQPPAPRRAATATHALFSAGFGGHVAGAVIRMQR